jgi:hypothetical protein
LFRAGDRWFESISLQRRVYCDTGVTRRRLLVSSSAIAASLLIGRYGRAEKAGNSTPFTLGVASGDHNWRALVEADIGR